MTKSVQVHVGDTLDAMGARFVDAWHRAERSGAERSGAGQGTLTAETAERHVGFASFAQFAGIMTPRRLELLRHVHREPARSVRALAQSLGRDYRRVHEDVEALVGAGLLDRDGTALRAEYDTVRLESRIAL